MTGIQNSAARYYSPATAVAVTILVFFGSQVVGALLFGAILLLIPGLSGLSGTEIQARLTENPWLYLGLIAAIEGLAVSILYWCMGRRSISLKALGFNTFQPSYVWKAAIGYAAVFGLSIVVLSGLSVLLPQVNLSQEQDLGITATASGAGLVAMFAALVVIPPFVEEFMMRGFLFTNLRSVLSFGWSSAIVSALFGLAHITQTENGLFWSGAINFFVLSMVLCYMREKTGSLWPCIGIHVLQNGVAFLALYIWKVA